MTARFALYLTPEPEEALWQFGSDWLGYDAEARAERPHPAIEGLTPGFLREATAHPRLYGLHVTVKAPFRLAAGARAEDVLSEVARLAARHAPFGPMALALEARPAGDDHVFLCLAPKTETVALHALEADAVVALDRFRAPLSASETARRNPDSLPRRERQYLEKFGYPYVLDAFRPHFSLTGPVSPGLNLHEILARKLAETPALTQWTCRSLAVFEQPEAGARFHVRQRIALAGPARESPP
jgi:hypothetical protein